MKTNKPSEIGKNSKFTAFILYLMAMSFVLLILVIFTYYKTYFDDVIYVLVSSLCTSLFGSFCVAVLWDIKAKQMMAEEMQNDFFSKIDSVVDDIEVKKLVEVNGLKTITTNMNTDIRWSAKIAYATNIDICWWSGRTWVKENRDSLRKFIDRGGFLRVILPDTNNKDTINQMCENSRHTKDVLRSAHAEAIDYLRTLISPQSEGSIELALSKRVNRYMYLRVDDIVAIAPYPLNRDAHFVGIPTIILNSNTGFGELFCKDFETYYSSLTANRLFPKH